MLFRSSQPVQIQPVQSQPLQSEVARAAHEQDGNVDLHHRRESGLDGGQAVVPQAQRPVQSQPVQSQPIQTQPAQSQPLQGEVARAAHEQDGNADLNHRRESGLDGRQPVVPRAPQPVQSHSIQSQALQNEAERERAAHEQGIDNAELYRRRESGLDEGQPLRR